MNFCQFQLFLILNPYIQIMYVSNRLMTINRIQIKVYVYMLMYVCVLCILICICIYIYI